MKIVVTGINGFVGYHLAKELKARGCHVVGIGHDEQPNKYLGRLIDGYNSCDLTDPEEVKKLALNDVDSVVSLAGLAKVGDSFEDPEKYFHVNVETLAVLCRRLLEDGSKARVIAVSSGAVYDSGQPLPLTEGSKVSATGSPYARSKIMMEKAASKFREDGLDCIIVRPFNHIGPGQGQGFLLPDLFAKIEAAKSSGKPMKVGNLKTKRDYTDVRDVARAYADLTLVNQPKYDIYNVCSGVSRSGQELLDILLNKTKGGDSIKVEIDRSLLRPNDIPELYGSYQRLSEETGWQPKIPLQTTIEDFVSPTTSESS